MVISASVTFSTKHGHPERSTLPLTTPRLGSLQQACKASRYRHYSLSITLTMYEFSLGPTTFLSQSSLGPSGKEISDGLISLIHLPDVDPNFLNMSARDPDELAEKASSHQGRVLADRRSNLDKYMIEAKHLAFEDGGTDEYAMKMIQFLDEKMASNESLWVIYNGQAEQARMDEFFQLSKNIWIDSLPNAMGKIEDTFEGPYTFGNHVVSVASTISPYPTSRS